MRKNTAFLTMVVICFLIFSLAGCNPTAPVGDYGDAPDGSSTDYPAGFAQTGQFPTLFASNGAHTLSVNEATLGPGASVEEDAQDPNDPDGLPNLTNTDSDDGIVDLFVLLTQIPPPTTMTVNISSSNTNPGGTFYINALIDLNMDGKWGGKAAGSEPEWVVQNYPVVVNPGASTEITPPAFAFSNGNRLPDGAWMRIALTREQVITSDWDGTGEFSSGEIEDHVIKLPEMGSKQVPILVVDCNGPYRFNGANQINVQCNVTNLHPTAGGNFDYRLVHTGTGTVKVGNCLPPAPLFIPAAGVVAVTCTATKGNLPDTWRFIATVKDPDAVVTEGGIHLGHSDESIVDFEFADGAEKQLQAFVNALEGYFEHFTGFSTVNIVGSVYFDDPEPLPGATVSLQMSGPSSVTTTATTDENGDFTAEFEISQFGTYTVEVIDITGENVEYAADKNVISSVTVDVQ